jgi:hypothetical protein
MKIKALKFAVNEAYIVGSTTRRIATEAAIFLVSR